nr:pyruvate kinase [uncultured Cohaesibacter sp.]
MQIQELLSQGGSRRSLAEALLCRLQEIRSEIFINAERTMEAWRDCVTRPDFMPSAENLALYLALRNIDLTQEQKALSALGLSSLGRSESHVQATLQAVISLLEDMLGEGITDAAIDNRLTMPRRQIEARRDEIFGIDPRGNTTRIQVTLPSEAADDPKLVADLVHAGASSVRINCAHDNREAWGKMVNHAHAAANEAGRKIAIMMDLAGPKVRIATMHAPKSVLAREKKKKLKKLAKEGIDPASSFGLLMPGDHIILSERLELDSPYLSATLSHSQLLDQLKPDAMVWIDDGKIGARVESVSERWAQLEICRAPVKGARLRPEKGVNLPGTAINIPALCSSDMDALDFAIGHADIIGFSFVQTTADIRDLQREIAKRLPEGAKAPALVLKIETDLALHNLPRLIVQAGGIMPVAVMIARGDLAVELGLERLSEIQEEILWLCEAAQVPVIWATQVLEGLAKRGFASRAETTDAAMSQRAECVMLNKGPHAVEAVAFLAQILRRMDRHQMKKTPRLAPLRAWRDPKGI